MSNKRKSEADDIEQIYQKKTQLEHILLRPDTYIGSIETYQQMLWIYDRDNDRIDFKQINYVPDEILVNAADNYHNDKTMNLIKVEIDPEQNMISVWNNGKGIPVQIHKVYNCYVPDMIFGQLLTSSNYDDNKKKVTGGRNGFGAKLANIFSNKFIIETQDSKNQKYYKQVWKDNMSVREEPIIKPIGKGEDFTCITFYPDLQRFKMNRLDEDMVSLMTKRVYDLAGVTPGSISVKLNGKKLEIKNFLEYCDLYLKNDETKQLPKIIEKTESDARWQIVASLSDGSFQQVSFVNSICTFKGGSHVSYISDQIVDKIQEVLKKKHKTLDIKPSQIRNNLWVFINCQVENPAFDSQTKETLTTKPSNFGSTCTLSEKFLKEIISSGIIESIVTVAKAKEEAKMAKNLNQGKKKTKLMGIPKLEDANDAGGRHAQECTIILTEGDSAKSLALAGIEVVGRDKYGVFPLRGKFLNVREASNKQIMENPEIQNLIKIIGLKVGKKYEDVSDLRYGSLMIMTDQDHDGSHIKGLLINFIHHFWPSLMQNNGFMKEFVTPIIKATKGDQVYSFFTIPEYEQWAEGRNIKGWKIKYYKGLGTSTAKEAKEYFTAIDNHQIEFEYVDIEDEEVIDLAFNKKLADKRKEWLTTYRTDLYVDHSQNHLRYKDFVNKELILFSVADCLRSIPNLCDGLKPGQRKILYSVFKRRLRDEIKVAQLVGYVGEHSAYHHGEQSLCQTIITMAQNFVGSNNINLLLPIGQFGTRNMGGKEAASPRYIFTNVNPVTRFIFHPDDDYILNYLEEEGQSIEPDYYLPIIPMSLINGAEGIGTGWSTFIPCHNPRDIAANLKRIMRGEEYQPLQPWYKGYLGSIEQLPGGKQYLVRGNYELNEEGDLVITELPIGMWTRNFKNLLEELADQKNGEIVEDIKEFHTENRVHFVVRCNQQKLQEIIEKEGIEKKFKLSTTISTANYVLFDYLGKIRRFVSEKEILEEFFDLRKQLYIRRKEYLLAKLRKEFEQIENKVRFILAIINEEIRLNKVKRKVVIQQLRAMGLKTATEINDILPEKKRVTIRQDSNENEEVQPEQEVEENLAPDEIPAKEYDYLLNMPVISLTEEKVEELQRLLKDKKQQYDKLFNMHIFEIWEHDLDQFLDALEKHEYEEEQDRLAHGDSKAGGKKFGKKRAAGGGAKGKKGEVAVVKKGGDASAKKKPQPKQTTLKQPQAPPQIQQVKENEMSLMDRIKMKQAADGKTLPKQSILKEMKSNERDAIMNGKTTRRAPSSDGSSERKQMKQIPRQRVVADLKRLAKKDQKPVVKPKKRTIMDSDDEEEESDESFFMPHGDDESI
ncbi:dna gyrase topoisomerase a subunit family protein [Stylonychia lemnae]|uniref:DNA topoisomerase 2 n=1 Tax=Stylonychia lemnae TaxID=5949 RepID=A0A078A3H8_STYLE|nr:dna gyrase topoisomerase a subunit family protein [Stylonychia lemnae]|eukprot:CDW75314.1 dna gyrase topoisomerase a subunit family protein [Stylonychia lemnae]